MAPMLDSEWVASIVPVKYAHDEYKVYSTFYAYRSRNERDEESLAGHRADIWRRTPQGFDSPDGAIAAVRLQGAHEHVSLRYDQPLRVDVDLRVSPGIDNAACIVDLCMAHLLGGGLPGFLPTGVAHGWVIQTPCIYRAAAHARRVDAPLILTYSATARSKDPYR